MTIRCQSSHPLSTFQKLQSSALAAEVYAVLANVVLVKATGHEQLESMDRHLLSELWDSIAVNRVIALNPILQQREHAIHYEANGSI